MDPGRPASQVASPLTKVTSGITGIGHVGISVADIGRSIAFYRDLLGMELVGQGPFEGERYEAILGLPGAHGEVATLRAGSIELELFQFVVPTPKAGDPNRPVSAQGITHFCIEVTDIRVIYERLAAAGVRFNCPPLEFAGIATATYGRDPDGNVFELMEKMRGSVSDELPAVVG